MVSSHVASVEDNVSAEMYTLFLSREWHVVGAIFSVYCAVKQSSKTLPVASHGSVNYTLPQSTPNPSNDLFIPWPINQLVRVRDF